MTLFDLTTRPGPELLFRRDEPGDPRLGETVLTIPGDYPSAPVVLVGCPQDEGVRRNGGRPGASAAPDGIRHWLYRLVAPQNMRLFDLGNTIIQSSLEETHMTHEQVIETLLRDGKTVISLGGGNDIAYPDCRALAAVAENVIAINIDAHFDVRESEVTHSGTAYRQLLDGGHIDARHFYETAYQPFSVSESHWAYVTAKGAATYPLREVQAAGAYPFYRDLLARDDGEAVFWGVDMDSVRAADAPGVSAPNPAGLSGDDLLAIAAIAGHEPRTRIFEISEVNPAHDIDGRTCRLAAAAIWTFLSAFYERPIEEP